jgi:hypothetical protein
LRTKRVTLIFNIRPEEILIVPEGMKVITIFEGKAALKMEE